MKEALKLALEALESFAPHNGVFWRNLHKDDAEIAKAITAIKEALAQKCVCGEPNGAGTHRTDGPCLAPQRTWVGLTDEERDDIILNSTSKNKAVAKTEAKLKEKNT